jgi:hypothetical protein
VPARVARLSVGQRAIQGERRAAASQHQMESPARDDGSSSFRTHRCGQRGHQRIGIG